MNKKELFRRYIILIAGLFFSGIGVAFSKHSDLGVSPITSVANVLSLKYSAISLGSWIIIWNCVMILGQIVILRKDFKMYQLLQVPLSFLFGWFTDIGMKFVSLIPLSNYFTKILLLLIGVVVLAFGIALSVIADVIMNSGEALVKAISDKSHFEFGYVKVGFDIFCVISAIVLSMIFFNGKIIGTREGTIISALCTGIVIKFITKYIRKYVDKIITHNL
ncbi:MAG: YitT family protein [Oscillospiraceae bacterium]|nr:YitT family protein [Oscillospiraceae bacterium]